MAIQEQSLTLTVEKLEEKIRLDAYLAQQGLRRAILSEPGTTILLNGNPAKKAKPIKNGDTITVTYIEEIFDGLTEQDIPLRVLYEDEELLVINKEEGMVVHPALGNHDSTVVNALLGRYGMDFSKIFVERVSKAQDEIVVEKGKKPENTEKTQEKQ